MQSPSNINTLQEQIPPSVLPNVETTFHLHPYQLVNSWDVQWAFLKVKIMKTDITAQQWFPSFPTLCPRAAELKVAQAGDFENAVQEFVTLSCKTLFKWLLWCLRSPVFIQLRHYSAFAILLKVCCILHYKLYIIIRGVFFKTCLWFSTQVCSTEVTSMAPGLSPWQKNQRPCEQACHTPCLMIRQVITIILWPIFWLVNDWAYIPSQSLKILFTDLLYGIALKELAFVLGDSQIALMMEVCFGLPLVHLSCSPCAYMSINIIYIHKIIGLLSWHTPWFLGGMVL